MAKESRTKKNQLFLDWRDSEVHTLNWFNSRKISNQLVQQYLNSGLIKKLGGGAYIKAKDKLYWQSAIFTAQTESNLPIHIGGRSIFDLHGSSQHLSLGKKPSIFVIARKRIRIPIWLKQNDWNVEFQFKISRLFEDDLGLEIFKKSKFEIAISSRERAIMEMIDDMNLSESFETLEQYFEGLISIRSNLTQKLLERCSSIKVKRVFLYMVTYMGLPIAKKLNVSKINLGRGKRMVTKNGMLNKTFNITVPQHHDGNKEP